MPSPQVLDIDALLEPIAGDDPAGNAVPFGTRKQLDEFRKELLPESFPADDPMRPEQPKYADWEAIIKLGEETLKDTSKDLLVAARLTEALIRHNGFAGLRDGLRLMRRMVEEAWDRIYPTIEDGDLEVRAAAFNWLDDPDRGARFPTTIRQASLIPNGEKGYSWQDWRSAHDGKAGVTTADLDGAIESATYEDCQNIADDVTECLDEIALITGILDPKLNDVAPGMVEAKRAITECQNLIKQVLAKKPPPVSAEEDVFEVVPSGEDSGDLMESLGDGGGSSDGSEVVRVVSAPAAPRPFTREDAYNQLEQLSHKLLRLDPHSPVTYLVMRAVKLSKLTLPELLKVLVRNSDSLADLSRDLDLGVQESSDDDD